MFLLQCSQVACKEMIKTVIIHIIKQKTSWLLALSYSAVCLLFWSQPHSAQGRWWGWWGSLSWTSSMIDCLWERGLVLGEKWTCALVCRWVISAGRHIVILLPMLFETRREVTWCTGLLNCLLARDEKVMSRHETWKQSWQQAGWHSLCEPSLHYFWWGEKYKQ